MSKSFPEAIPLWKLLGPSFIILALGLGSGEIILWPYLVSNYGLGIFWAAVLGISCQYFINMEIARYALIKGESVFVGLNKVFPWSPYWFIFSTFIGFGLPGIIAASAQVLSTVLGVEDFRWAAIALLIFIGAILSVSKTVYGTMEKLTEALIAVGVIFIFLLTIFLSTTQDWWLLLKGLAGSGDGYFLFPAGISLATFMAAFAYSGAGGNLNLTQSIYVKEKGYGMGKYSQKITGLFTGIRKKQAVRLEGEAFELTEENISRFKQWWRRISLEHLIVFWLIGVFTIGLLMVLSYITTAGLEGNAIGIHFVINEGQSIAKNIFPFLGLPFLLIVSLMLFQTQLGVLDSTSRIMAENVAIKKLQHDKSKEIHLSKIYFTFLWLQIAFGVLLFLVRIHEPRSLIVLGAVINAVSMTVHIALVNIMNYKSLPKQLQANTARKVVLMAVFCIFAGFTSYTIIDTIF